MMPQRRLKLPPTRYVENIDFKIIPIIHSRQVVLAAALAKLAKKGQASDHPPLPSQPSTDTIQPIIPEEHDPKKISKSMSFVLQWPCSSNQHLIAGVLTFSTEDKSHLSHHALERCTSIQETLRQEGKHLPDPESLPNVEPESLGICYRI